MSEIKLMESEEWNNCCNNDKCTFCGKDMTNRIGTYNMPYWIKCTECADREAGIQVKSDEQKRKKSFFENIFRL